MVILYYPKEKHMHTFIIKFYFIFQIFLSINIESQLLNDNYIFLFTSRVYGYIMFDP